MQIYIQIGIPFNLRFSTRSSSKEVLPWSIDPILDRKEGVAVPVGDNSRFSPFVVLFPTAETVSQHRDLSHHILFAFAARRRGSFFCKRNPRPRFLQPFILCPIWVACPDLFLGSQVLQIGEIILQQFVFFPESIGKSLHFVQVRW